MTLTDRESITSNVGQGTFNFLGLPAEVRAMIYHHHLTAGRILPQHHFREMRWKPINLLYVCRTIYDEAFLHLYTKGKFVLSIWPHENPFGLGTCPGMGDMRPSSVFELFVKSQKIRRIIRHIALDIHLPSIEYSFFTSSDDTSSAVETLRPTMAAVGTMLSRLPGLRTIDISWPQMTLRIEGLEKTVPPGHKMQRFKQVRRRNKEKLLFRLLANGPVSTEQLEMDPRDMGKEPNILGVMREEPNNLGVMREDEVAEMLGLLREWARHL